MSTTQCGNGTTSGFPLKLYQSLYSNWPATLNPEKQLKKITIPTDFEFQWQNTGVESTISVTKTTDVFQIKGFNNVGSTISYGTASYKCSDTISIVKNQHTNFSQDARANYEMILSFQIINKDINPSSPHIILVCRPLLFTETSSDKTTGTNTEFWKAVNDSANDGSSKKAKVDLSTFFGYNSNTPMPVITYETCLPIKYFMSNSDNGTTGSLRIRVHVVPLHLTVLSSLSSTGIGGLCSNISRYTLVGNVPDIIGAKILQFKDGLGPDGFPSIKLNNLKPLSSAEVISAFDDVLNKVQILVPEAFLDKSIDDIASSYTAPITSSKNKPYKCYTINPEKDIINGEIMVDPTTGETLQETIKKENLSSTNVSSTSLMPGDITRVVSIVIRAIGVLLLCSYFAYIFNKFIRPGQPGSYSIPAGSGLGSGLPAGLTTGSKFISVDNPLLHVVIFVGSIITLFLISIF